MTASAIDIRVGDMRDQISSIGDASVDLVFADPPYGETELPWDKWPKGWPSLARRVLKPSGSMWVFGSLRMFFERLAEFGDWRFVQELVWEKHNGSGFLVDRFRRVHEHVCHFVPVDAPWVSTYRDPQFTNDALARVVRRKSKPAHWHTVGPSTFRSEDGGPKLMRSVIYARSSHGRSWHPTQKPLEVVEPVLRYSCPHGGVVLDPFAGSGTVGIAARRNGRRAILIEADAAFAAACAQRLASDAPLFSGAPA